MRNTILAGILAIGLVGCTDNGKQKANDVAQLKQRVAQLEEQVQQMSQLLEPFKAQQRTKMLRERFERKMAQDQAKYTQDQLRDAERLYQIANQKWGTPEATESLQTMMKKYPDINRTGCAALYVAQKSEGEQRARYLQQCIEKFNDCYYGDGVQVGAFARFMLAEDYRSKGDEKKAAALCNELRAKYPDAVDHSGKLLVESIKSDSAN